jgi:hypothetical protein
LNRRMGKTGIRQPILLNLGPPLIKDAQTQHLL